MSSFIKIRLIGVPDELEDVITGHSFDFGALGISEALAYSQPDLTYDPEILHLKKRDLEVFFDKKPDEAFFQKLLEWNSQIKWQITEEENKDWLAEWKKGFVSFKLVGDCWVVPSWLTAPPEAKEIIKIDPGMAFGTGTHATTKMAAYFVHKLASSHQNLQQKSLVDVGTGTAILAMLANLRGLDRILGVEIDPEARRVAKENVILNAMNGIEITDKTLEQVHESFDFVVANIIDGVLIQIRQELLRVLKPEGEIFLTGVLLEREEHFMREFIEKSPLKLLRRIENDEWVGYWLKHTPEA